MDNPRALSLEDIACRVRGNTMGERLAIAILCQHIAALSATVSRLEKELDNHIRPLGKHH